jgi:putative ABC transport system substrate-binding protein
MRRREFIALLGGAAASPILLQLAARAQQAGKIYRIGFLGNDPTIPATAAGRAFLEGLRESGFVEGRNIVIERRFAQGNRDSAFNLAAELVQLELDLLVVSGASPMMAAKQTDTKIPIVMVNAIDPVGEGIVTSLAFPGGNITGLASHASVEITSKRLALLKEAVPQIARIAVLLRPDIQSEQTEWEALQRAARSLDVTLQPTAVRRDGELVAAFASISRERPDALFAAYNAFTLIYRKLIVDFAAESRLPAMYPFTELAEVGGLMSYGASRPDLFRRAAIYVGKILKGAKPADLPVELPTKFELVINLKAAKTLGLTIPHTLLARADRVIE